jgi:hypothetical protein
MLHILSTTDAVVLVARILVGVVSCTLRVVSSSYYFADATDAVVRDRVVGCCSFLRLTPGQA